MRRLTESFKKYKKVTKQLKTTVIKNKMDL